MNNLQSFLDLAIAIQQIPAPTFKEEKRASYVLERFKETQADTVYQDACGNIHALIKCDSSLPELYLTAHLDTVFSEETDISYQLSEAKLAAPGIGDNSIAVAALIWVAAHIKPESLNRSLHFVANIAEEGNGNLKGIRHVCDTMQRLPHAMIILEGAALGQIYCQSIGVKRFRLEVKALGGHSWANYGNSSAIHELAKIAAKIASLPISDSGNASLNIGLIQGGTTINTIAANAWLELDLRSISQRGLNKLVRAVKACAPHSHNRTWSLQWLEIGDRPAGALAEEHPLVKATQSALADVGWRTKPELVSGSTDANIPLSQGIPAIVTGITTGGNIHRTSEYIDLPPIQQGLDHLFLLIEKVCALSDADIRFR